MSVLIACVTLVCPCCSSDHLKSFDTIRPAASIVATILADQKVRCRRCHQVGQLRHLKAHLESQCASSFTPPQAVEDIVNRPRDSPLTPMEKKLQSSLVRWSISTSPVLQVKTGGQVSLEIHSRLPWFKYPVIKPVLQLCKGEVRSFNFTASEWAVVMILPNSPERLMAERRGKLLLISSLVMVNSESLSLLKNV